MELVLTIHGYMRWLVVLVAIIAIVKFALGWLRRMEYKSMDRGLVTGFTSLMDLNLLMGLVLLFGLGDGFSMERVKHTSMMIVAVFVTHSSAIWREADAVKKFRNNTFVFVVALILVLVSVISLRGGWVF